MQAATAAEPMPATWCEIVRRNVARHGLLVMGVDPLRERVPDALRKSVHFNHAPIALGDDDARRELIERSKSDGR